MTTFSPKVARSHISTILLVVGCSLSKPCEVEESIDMYYINSISWVMVSIPIWWFMFTTFPVRFVCVSSVHQERLFGTEQTLTGFDFFNFTQLSSFETNRCTCPGPRRLRNDFVQSGVIEVSYLVAGLDVAWFVYQSLFLTVFLVCSVPTNLYMSWWVQQFLSFLKNIFSQC